MNSAIYFCSPKGITTVLKQSLKKNTKKENNHIGKHELRSSRKELIRLFLKKAGNLTMSEYKMCLSFIPVFSFINSSMEKHTCKDVGRKLFIAGKKDSHLKVSFNKIIKNTMYMYFKRVKCTNYV